MPQNDTLTVSRERLREIVHRYNNLAAGLLSCAEIARTAEDPSSCDEMLQEIEAIALEVGSYTRKTWAELVADQ